MFSYLPDHITDMISSAMLRDHRGRFPEAPRKNGATSYHWNKSLLPDEASLKECGFCCSQIMWWST